MKSPREVRLALAILRDRLSGWTAATRVRPRVITFPTPPLLTDREIFGIQLRDIVVPPCYIPPPELGHMFDELVWWHKDGAPEEYRDRMVVGLRGRAKRFVGVSPERFALWAGRHRDVRLNTDDGNLIVEGEVTFGFADGEAFSPCIKFEWGADELQTLREPGVGQTRDRGFIALWEQARRKRDVPAQELLGALKCAYDTPLVRLAPWVRDKEVVVSGDELGEVIERDDDPIAALYVRLVPSQISRMKFERIFGALKSRPLDLDTDDRRGLWEKCRRSGLV